MSDAVISAARQAFHSELTTLGPLSMSYVVVDSNKKSKHQEWVASNADVSQSSSRKIAYHIAKHLGAPEREKGPGQTAGGSFEAAVAQFVENTFPSLKAVRPGSWTVENVGGKRSTDHVAQYHPYRHLDDLAQAIQLDHKLESVLGNSYVVSPDVLVLRDAVTDRELNSGNLVVVDSNSALKSPFRSENAQRGGEQNAGPAKFVHAVISCKWTMRSDRAQNTRSEALNLIRNRKGRTPHIVAVTAEPTLSRIASLALGTGDIDLVYHAFLPELVAAVEEVGTDDAKEMLETLINGDRLRDIADMPLDLAV